MDRVFTNGNNPLGEVTFTIDSRSRIVNLIIERRPEDDAKADSHLNYNIRRCSLGVHTGILSFLRMPYAGILDFSSRHRPVLYPG